jgi:hypothetical protein
MEEQSFSTLNRGAESNPARVLWRGAWHDWKVFIFNYTHNQRIALSIEAHGVLDRFNPALNREGVELTFNQSYRFELTTNPLGKHYINS